MNSIYRHYIVLSRYIHYHDTMAIKYRDTDSSTIAQPYTVFMFYMYVHKKS